MTVCKERVERSFSRAASTYEKFTFFQKRSADDFALFLRSRRIPEPARILEAGCGTGLLTARLRTLFPSASIFSTDLSAGMISFCRSRFAEDGAIRFACHDFDRPYEESGFDLAVSSLSLQWSADLPWRTADFHSSFVKPAADAGNIPSQRHGLSWTGTAGKRSGEKSTSH